MKYPGVQNFIGGKFVPFTVENPGDDIYLLNGFHEVREVENVFGANISRWQVFAPRQDNDEWQMYWTDGGQWHAMRETPEPFQCQHRRIFTVIRPSH